MLIPPTPHLYVVLYVGHAEKTRPTALFGFQEKLLRLIISGSKKIKADPTISISKFSCLAYLEKEVKQAVNKCFNINLGTVLVRTVHWALSLRAKKDVEEIKKLICDCWGMHIGLHGHEDWRVRHLHIFRQGNPQKSHQKIHFCFVWNGYGCCSRFCKVQGPKISLWAETQKTVKEKRYRISHFTPISGIMLKKPDLKKRWW